jgi:LPXTG-site transpeptidase (sortase) family protein
LRFWSVLVAALTLLPACGSARAVQSAGRPEPPPPSSAIAPSEPDSSAASIPDDPLTDPRVVDAPYGRNGGSSLSGDTATEEAPVLAPDEGPGIFPAEPAPPPTPVALWVDGIEIVQAPVVEVGVEPNGEMEIPGGSEVGWYKYGPSPGSEGSAVLAAHVAFDGQDGVFRHLDDVSAGSRIVVGYDDGSTADFEIVDLQQYGKAELPFERVFAKQGDPVLTLITCGGAFDSSSRSYADNVVAYAVAVKG